MAFPSACYTSEKPIVPVCLAWHLLGIICSIILLSDIISINYREIWIGDWGIIYSSIYVHYLHLQKGELPAGRTAVSSSNVASSFRDMDIERELNELRKKANEY